MNPRAAPIGVFDSGVGGLTVLRALREALPSEDFIYLGDTARLPYGTKSPQTVARYSVQCAAALVARGIRRLVVACNTASASALEDLRARYPDMPVVGVIEPGAAAAVAASRSQHIAVIGTEGTISGGAYQAAIRRLNPHAKVAALPCSLFVSLAEEGWTAGPLAEAVAHRYLDRLFRAEPGGPTLKRARAEGPDTLVLGCTHFPLLSAAIRAVLPPGVRIVDSAATTAAAVREQIFAAGVVATPVAATSPAAPPAAVPPAAAVIPGSVIWLATDGAARFARIGSAFLGETLRAEQVHLIDL